MPRRLTAKAAKSADGEEKKLYIKRAREALPFLVRQAKAEMTIEYGALAAEMGMPNARNLNYVLGAVGNMLIALGEKEDIDIPQIQCLVVNKKTGLPSDGVDWFLDIPNRNYLHPEVLKRKIHAQITRACSWDRWDWVLEKLNLRPIKLELRKDLEEAKKGGGGESPDHLSLKYWIMEHPEALGIRRHWDAVDGEWCLASSDRLDILFKNAKEQVAVEVKSKISGQQIFCGAFFNVLNTRR